MMTKAEAQRLGEALAEAIDPAVLVTWIHGSQGRRWETEATRIMPISAFLPTSMEIAGWAFRDWLVEQAERCGLVEQPRPMFETTAAIWQKEA